MLAQVVLYFGLWTGLTFLLLIANNYIKQFIRLRGRTKKLATNHLHNYQNLQTILKMKLESINIYSFNNTGGNKKGE